MTIEASDTHELRRVAVAAECDPRSVAKYLRGQPLRPTLETRLQRAFEQLGLKRPKRRRVRLQGSPR